MDGCKSIVLTAIIDDDLVEFPRFMASRAIHEMFQEVYPPLLAFRFICRTSGIEGLVLKGRDGSIYDDNDVEVGIDGVMLRAEFFG